MFHNRATSLLAVIVLSFCTFVTPSPQSPYDSQNKEPAYPNYPQNNQQYSHDGQFQPNNPYPNLNAANIGQVSNNGQFDNPNAGQGLANGQNSYNSYNLNQGNQGYQGNQPSNSEQQRPGQGVYPNQNPNQGQFGSQYNGNFAPNSYNYGQGRPNGIVVDHAQPLSDPVVNTTASTPTTNSTDSEYEDGEAESLADFVIENISEMFDHKDKKVPDTTTPVISEEQQDECKTNMVLSNVCEDITTDTVIHFGDDLSLQRIKDDMFDPSLISALKACPRGQWCLEYKYHDAIKSNGWKFDEIYCVNNSGWSMRDCLERLKLKYPNCMDQEAEFMFKSINLLCDMWDNAFMENECYTRTKKSLYVLLREQREGVQHELDIASCSNYTVELTRTYLCADDACHYDQQQMLLKFEPFNKLGQFPEMEWDKCNISGYLECQGEDYRGDYYYDYDDMYEDYDDEDEYETYEDNMDDIIEQIMNTVKGTAGVAVPHEGGDYNEYSSQNELTSQDRVLFVGLVAAVVILAVGFLLLIVFGFRRYRTGSEGIYPVYTKLATDEEANKTIAQF